MKQAILTLLVFTLTACGNDPSPDPAPTAPAAASDTAASEGPQVPAIVEFVWHQKADGFTDDALWSHADYWSNVAGEADWGLMVAAVMTPRIETENFDFLWVWRGHLRKRATMRGQTGEQTMNPRGWN